MTFASSKTLWHCLCGVVIWLTIIGQISARDSSFVQRMNRVYDIPFSHDNSIVVLASGQAKFDDMFSAIKQAKHSIHLEYFNFRNDSIAGILFDLLAKKAAEGVQVRALFDGFGNDSNNKPLKREQVKALRERGIAIHEFDPITFPWLNHVFHRDHRKIVVIDNCIAYTGGMNVADYYITGTETVGTWRDLHVRITGGAVETLQGIFAKLWEKVTREKLDIKSFPDAQTALTAFDLPYDNSTTAGLKTVGVVNREPRISPQIIRSSFVELINHAEKRIRIINPYPTMNRKIRLALAQAVERGVSVEIIVSVNSDIPLTPDLVNRTMYKLMQKGAQVYYYQGGFHHTKLLLVDDSLAFIGSANLNARSLRYDYECNLLVCDSNFVHELGQSFEQDKAQHCFLLTPGRWREFPRWRKFIGRALYWLTPFVYTPVSPAISSEPASMG